MPYEEARERLLGMGIPEERAQAFWAVIQPNLTKVGDAAEWWRIVAGEVTPVIADAGFAAAALDVLPSEPWDGQTWKAWTQCREGADPAPRARPCSCRSASPVTGAGARPGPLGPAAPHRPGTLWRRGSAVATDRTGPKSGSRFSCQAALIPTDGRLQRVRRTPAAARSHAGGRR